MTTNEQQTLDTVVDALAPTSPAPTAPLSPDPSPIAPAAFKTRHTSTSKEQPGRLTKNGKIVLIVALILSLCFTTIGIVLNSTPRTIKVICGIKNTVECEKNETLTFEFQPQENGYYRLIAEHAAILNVNGNPYRITSEGNNEYVTLYMDSNQTYKIRLRSEATRIAFLIELEWAS